MGKFVGLVGALTTVGAVAYLMAPLPPSASDVPATASAARSDVPTSKAVVAIRPPVTAPSLQVRNPHATPRAEPTVALIQQIQTELQRLGCYDGAIDGRWTDATQRAMQTLGERVSVLRPVDTPDYIMLALARDQSSTVCNRAMQRSAAAKPRDKWAAIATPEIASPGKGEVRPTNGTSRVATAEPGRPSASEPPKVWRAIPDAAAKHSTTRDANPSVDAVRLKAARDELMRIESRKRAATAANPAPQAPTNLTPQRAPVVTAANEPAQLSQPLPEASRMGLGVAPVDPLQAHIDPRNPNAPAILRGPPEPLPRFAAHSDPLTPVVEEAPQPARQAAPRPAKPELSASDAKKRAKREWMRNVFTNMRFNGP